MLVYLITQTCACIFQPNLCCYLSYLSSELKNFQAKITTYTYYRTHFTLQSKSLYNSKRRLLFFIKLQNHTLNECTNLLYKFEENPQTEFFSILLQTFNSTFSYILNNGFHTVTLTLSTCYTELSSLLLCKINYVIVKMVTLLLLV